MMRIMITERYEMLSFLCLLPYRIEQNFGGKNFWRNCDFETLAEKTLANPRLACIFIIVHAR